MPIFLLLTRAGWRTKDALTIYIFAKAFLPIVFVGGGIIFFGISHQAKTGGAWMYYVLGACAVFGLFGVDLLVKNAGDKRIKSLTRAVPDALDLMVICAEAGLSLDSAIKRVGQEMISASPEMADEFLLTAIELYFLPDRQRALLNLVKRTDMPKLRAMVKATPTIRKLIPKVTCAKPQSRPKTRGRSSARGVTPA